MVYLMKNNPEMGKQKKRKKKEKMIRKKKQILAKRLRQSFTDEVHRCSHRIIVVAEIIK